MLIYPDINPVVISAGPFQVHWYGLMYLIGFLGFWWLGRLRTRRPGTRWQAVEIGDVLFYGALGVVLGGRIGYTLVYNFPGFIADPLVLFRIWQGGMSFHGGLVGVLIAMWLYGRRTGRTFFQVTDFIAPMVPVGLGAGRIGNFINGELCSKDWCCSSSCGFIHADRAPLWLFPGCFCCVTGCSASWSSSCASPTRRSGTSPSTG
jgi:phosphatidylglycerol:prolipoprotein diacylglycerol transferase